MTTEASIDENTAGNGDDEALALRRQGRSFAGIAKTLGFERASEANDAFNRALRTRSSDEQVVLRDEENRRLDKLETRLQSRDDLAADDVNRQLRTIKKLRDVLMAE